MYSHWIQWRWNFWDFLSAKASTENNLNGKITGSFSQPKKKKTNVFEKFCEKPLNYAHVPTFFFFIFTISLYLRMLFRWEAHSGTNKPTKKKKKKKIKVGLPTWEKSTNEAGSNEIKIHSELRSKNYQKRILLFL